MRVVQSSASFVTTVALIIVACGCATKQITPESAAHRPETLAESLDSDALRQALRTALENRIREHLDGTAPATHPSSGQPGLEVLRAIQERIHADFRVRVESEFGMPGALAPETIGLEAVDAEGRVMEVEVDVPMRPLRTLTDSNFAGPTREFVQQDTGLDAFYGELPMPIAPVETHGFSRVYMGEPAEAIAMEARLIVTAKGGEWDAPSDEKPVANVVAVRGLDLDRGLRENTNLTYDDTMYVIVESLNAPCEVYEFRMTTESSSTSPGVGRLAASQVYYVRGRHRGTDPAFRLLGNSAPGSRAGMKGDFEIVGANIHSAYSRQPITSATPLRPNVSLGCQVIAASKRDFETLFIALFDTKGIRQFPYTIVKDEELDLWDSSLRQKDQESVLARALPRSEASL